MKIVRPLSPLRRRMLEDMQLRNDSPHTIDGYLRYAGAFAKDCKTSPEHLGAEHLRPSPLPLLHKQVAKSIVIQTVCALRFLYEPPRGRPWRVDDMPYPRQPPTLPVSLARDEVKAWIVAPPHLKHRVVLAPLYAPGWRVAALCPLPGTDMDSHRMGIQVRPGTGKRDRHVRLSPNLLPQLRRSGKLYGLPSWLLPGARLHEPSTSAGVAHIGTQAGKAAKLKKAM
jgi:integrase/recombinase XerD